MNINKIKKSSTRCYSIGKNKVCLYDINIVLTSYGPVVYQGGDNKLDDEIKSLVTDYIMKYEYDYHGSISADGIQIILSDSGEEPIILQKQRIINK